ncbi:hypothetical protein [Streptomyces iconiensis]|uniref:Excreted virulence factor EspC, type VII ESX diderm n=1 Tax=Streptomyces iconiensis TaxID=1384038 RepID=A0ABT7A2X9_9ACTN|nr:hypothetical protein [Streptomyces iconiensis]MDJ1135646.1 hypothetical protein [Streptomyces iconiensis]
MQLTQALEPGGGAPPAGDLKVSQEDLAAIGDAAFTLHNDLDRDGDHARSSSFKAGGELAKDFAVGGALDYVATRRVEQLRNVLDACAHISNHLDYTKHVHKDQDDYLGTVISRISSLEDGFGRGADR